VRSLALVAAVLVAGCGKGDCKVQRTTARVCIPDLAAAGATLAIAVADPCTSACTFAGLSCSATIDGESGSVELTVDRTDCATGGACVAVCVRRDVICSVPPLSPGDRQLVVNGAVAGTLHVAAGGAESCSLPPGPLPP